MTAARAACFVLAGVFIATMIGTTLWYSLTPQNDQRDKALTFGTFTSLLVAAALFWVAII